MVTATLVSMLAVLCSESYSRLSADRVKSSCDCTVTAGDRCVSDCWVCVHERRSDIIYVIFFFHSSSDLPQLKVPTLPCHMHSLNITCSLFIMEWTRDYDDSWLLVHSESMAHQVKMMTCVTFATTETTPRHYQTQLVHSVVFG